MLTQEMTRELVDGLLSILGNNVWQIVLYGSVARKDKFDKWGRILPFYKNICEEGVVLWKAA